MAADHFQNVIPTPIPSSSSFVGGRGHRPVSVGSSASSSGITASDAISGRQAGDSMSNSQLLGNSPRPIASDTNAHLQLHYSYTQRGHKSTPGMGTRAMRTWLCARYVLTAAVLSWVVYCTVRYFIAVQTYRGDHVRSRYALGMGITSAFTIVFFASETSMTLRFSDNQFYRRLRNVVHSLAYLSSALVLGLTIINLVLVNIWWAPHNSAQFGRSIQGRCHWDLDVVWSGTGMACAQDGATPFGDWLGAAIVRSVISAVFVIGYHLTVHGYPAKHGVQQMSATPDMEKLAETGPNIPAMGPLLSRSHIRHPSLVPVPITVSEDEHQRRSLSFTAAGQVLSRIEGSELGEDDRASSTSSSSDQHQRLGKLVHEDTSVPQLSDSPEALSSPEILSASSDSDMSSDIPLPGSNLRPGLDSGESAPNPRPSTYLRSIAAPSSDLQDFASAFRNLVSQFTRETTEGQTLSNSTRTPRHTVRVLGSNISRMSTIDSMASREAGSPARSPSSLDRHPSNASGSRNISRNSTSSGHGRGQDELLTQSSPSESADGHSS